MHELLNYRYHARNIQLTCLTDQAEASIAAQAITLQPQLTALATLMRTPQFLVPHLLDQYFKNPAQRAQALATAISFKIGTNFRQYLLDQLRDAALIHAIQSVSLDQNGHFSQLIPPYHLVFPDTEALKNLTNQSLQQAAEALLETIGINSPITRPRRDLALLISQGTSAVTAGENIFLISTSIEEVYLKLVYPRQSLFPNRFLYIQTLE